MTIFIILPLPEIIAKIIEDNKDFKPQISDELPCTITWRVIQNSCWAKYHCFDQENNFDVLIPCTSECCARKLKVCNEEGLITVTDEGFAFGSSTYNCSSAGVPLLTRPLNTTSTPDCKDISCDVFKDIVVVGEENYADRVDRFDDLMGVALAKKSKLDIDNNDLLMVYQSFNSNTILNIKIIRTLLDNITIDIYDIKGNLLVSEQFLNISNSMDLRIDLSNLKSGTYLFNLRTDLDVYSSGKFQIVK